MQSPTSHQRAPKSVQQGPTAKRRRTSNSAPEAARTSTACKACRDRKVKCSGMQPCRYCVKKKVSCIFPDHTRKKLYSTDYVEDLESKAAALEALEQKRMKTTSAGDLLIQQPWQDSPMASGLPTPTTLENEYQQLERSTQAPPNIGQAPDKSASALVPDSVTSSSLHFGSHIRSLGPTTDDSHQANRPGSVKVLSDCDDVYHLSTGGVIPPSSPPQLELPSEDEAHELLETMLNSVGRLQHLVEPRAVSDRLSVAYSTSPPSFDTTDIWYIEMLMVFAIGRLLKGDPPTTTLLPGTAWFLEAVRLLPNFTVLRSSGIVAVEIMGLMAMYLQCADKREDAYIYAGMGLRLALLNGMAQERGPMTVFRSERAHRNRLWWTIYMKERRLAAANGQPLSLHDDAISISLPTEAPGFFPSAAIRTNIQLTRIMGSIMQTVYGLKKRPIRSYLHNVKEVLGSLLEVARTMPADYVVDFSRDFSISRPSATLYNMLYQGIMLATRPMLLYVSNLSLTNKGHAEVALELGSLKKLAEACVEAAARSLQILEALIKRQLIAHYGFFDLDTAFSASFVFTLFKTLPNGTLKAPKSLGIGSADTIFRYLEQHGNRAAVKRRSEMKQICQHLGVEYPSPDISNSTSTDVSLPLNEQLPVQQYDSYTAAESHQLIQTESPNLFDWDGSGNVFINDLTWLPPTEDQLQSLSIDGLSSTIPDNWNEFLFVGVVEEDWKELGRQF